MAGRTPEEGDALPVESSLDLIQRARDGDDEALGRLFDRYAGPLRRWAAGRLPRRARGMIDTDDLVQDALIKTFRNLGHFEPRRSGALHVYLRQALRRRIIDEVRGLAGRPGASSLDDRQEARDPSPLDEAIGAQALERYERALEALSETEREAVLARVELGLGYAEIAATLGRPSPDAARMTVARALLRLAREMDVERP